MRSSFLICCVCLLVTTAGCADKRQWGAGATRGALIGAAVGGASGAGIEAGLGHDSAADIGKAGAIGVGAGLLIGGVVGHFLWDVEKAPAPALAAGEKAGPEPEAVEGPPQRTVVLPITDVRFGFDRYEIPDDFKEPLDKMAAELKSAPAMTVVVEGHTDSIGDDSYNLELGQRRADAVRRYLIGSGVQASRLEARSFGESKPVASNDTEEGREKNRRVELQIRNGNSNTGQP